MYGWRGTIGLVKPTFKPGPLEAFIRLLPEGVCVIPRYVGLRSGTEKEFQEAQAMIDRRVGELVTLKANLALVQGAPQFMLLGLEFDQATTRRLEKKHGISVLSSTQVQIDALRALRARRIIGLTYFSDELNAQFKDFFERLGVKVVAMASIDVPFSDVGRIPAEEIARRAKEVFAECGDGDCLYLMGAAWDCLSVIEPLERELNIKVLANVPADVWACMKQLKVHMPIAGYGRLLAELP